MANVITKGLQSYWRVSRGLTMGAQGVVLTPDDRVLLIRHTYRPGWHFPGGGVEKNETLRTTLERELQEEAGVVMTGPAALFSVYANFKAFPSDHIGLFVVRDWEQPNPPKPNAEIAEHGLFPVDALPEGAVAPVQRRLDEILRAAPVSDHW
jgi:8-oxo-dGTP pyrophosphatase MutT (NUDIX family)